MRYVEGTLVNPPGKFAIAVARFNSFITEELLKGALDALTRHGVSEDSIDVYRVPGTFELPGLLRRLSEGGGYAGLISLGAVIRGGTPHFEHVCAQVASGVAEIARSADCAVVFGVLTCDTVEQAIDRAGVKAGNKGAEAAVACIEMVNLYARMAGKRR